MFEVYGNDITLDGTKIGHLEGGWKTLQDRARDMLEGMAEGFVSEEDHVHMVEDAEKEAFEKGRIAQRDEMAPELAAAKEEAFDEGFTAGRARAIDDMGRARDVARLTTFMDAVSDAHDTLFKVASQRYPAAKVSELRRASVAALTALRQAVSAFRA